MRREKGVTLIEFVFTITIFIFILLGITKGIIDYQKAQKRAQIFNTARIILETIRSEVETKSFFYFERNITNYYQTSANCTLNGTCSFDIEDCYINPRYGVNNCLPNFNCIYCLQGNQLISQTANCSSGYQYNVGFNVSKIVDVYNPAILLGYGICIRVWFKDPMYNQTKDYRTTVIVKKWI